MTERKKDKSEKLLDFVRMSDRDFYETYLTNLSKEEAEKFFEENPDFDAKGCFL